MDPIVSMNWVYNHLHHPHQVIVDCRFILGNPEAGRKAYHQEHIPGAIYLDLEKDLSGPIQKHGGRHPLPDLETFAKKLGNLGINENIRVIAYDDQGGAMASRLRWLLTYIGHPQTYVMDQGFTKWKEQGYPTTNQIPSYEPLQFIPKPKMDYAADYDEVKEKMKSQDTIIIDSREPKRYRGEEEPIDAVAGHIPGAKNYFWKEVLTGSGTWKDENQLKQHFQALPKDKEIIVYCGSGITATPNILALKKAGFSRVKLYPGSWSDWISHPEAPIAKGEE